VDDARLALALGVDFLGLIFAESPRRVDLAAARTIRCAVPDAVLVGVFVDAPQDDVTAAVTACGLNYVQLHGTETPEYCERLRVATATPIIKAFRVRDVPDKTTLGAYETTSLFLFDLDRDTDADDVVRTMGDLWEDASQRRREGFRTIIAGALDVTNVREAIEKTSAFCVDVCRGVEASAGVKDPAALAGFIAEVRR
jgi:phosphoribosylanthranilate isomerase